jgi:hypothetical protein
MKAIHTLAQPFKLAKKTAALQRDLNEQIDSFNSELAAHEREVSKLAQASPESLDANFAAAEELPKRSRELLMAEARLRRSLFPYFELAEADLQMAREKAFEEHQAAREDVATKLIEMGYEKCDLPSSTEPQIHPSLIMMHPRVKNAYVETQRLTSISFDTREYSRNRLRAIDEELVIIQRRLLAGAAR